MPFPLIRLALSGASGLLGMLQNKNKQTQTSSTSPTMDPAYGPLQQMLINSAMARLQTPSALPTNYEGAGVNAINRSYDLAGQGLDNTLTSRGLGASPVAATAAAKLTNGRAGEIGQFRAGVPIAERQMRDQDLNGITSLLNFGRGSTTSGTSTQTGGGGLAGGATNLMQMLGYLYGQGAFGGGRAAGAPTGFN